MDLVIVVRGGLVQSVYTHDPALNVMVLDFDSEDPDRNDELEKELKKVEESNMVDVW